MSKAKEIYCNKPKCNKHVTRDLNDNPYQSRNYHICTLKNKNMGRCGGDPVACNQHSSLKVSHD